MVVPHQPWADFLAASRPSVDWQKVGTVVCLDPGETTGWAVFTDGSLVEWGQWATPEPGDMFYELRDCLDGLLNNGAALERLVYEEYRVRGNKFKEHVGSEVVTIQHIGVVKVVAGEYGIPLTKQTAGQVKGFATDTKLRRWGLWAEGQRHANDAIRHGVYYHLFMYGRKMPTKRTGGL